MKLILACVVIIGGMLIGRTYAGSGVRRARMLSGMMDALQILRIAMLDRLTPLRTALEASSFPAFRCIGEEMNGKSAAEAWGYVRDVHGRRGGMIDCLTDEDLCVADALFAGLGTSGCAQQEILIANALRALGSLEAAARKNVSEKNRLYTTLGLLAGIALAIAFI